MKKLFTICVSTLCMCMGMQAQKLATFEEGANDYLTIDGWWNPDLYVEGAGPSLMDNTAKGGINTSNRCVGAVNMPDADWWGNFFPLKLKEPITITEDNCFLKFSAYRSIQPKNLIVYFNDYDNEVWRGKLSTDAEWHGIAIDLSKRYLGQELKNIIFCVSANWDEPRGGWGAATYLFDDFELSNDPLPTGVVPIKDLSAFNVNFENQETTDTWVAKMDGINETNTVTVIDNPVSSSINGSSKVVQFDKSAEASWWQGYRAQFAGALEVSDAHKYMHVMVWVPEAALGGREVVDVQLYAQDFTGNENVMLQGIWDDEVDGWIDLVMDVNRIKYVTEVQVRFDIQKNNNDEYINSPANKFYVDEIVMNNESRPRTSIVTGIDRVDALPEVKVIATEAGIKVYTAKTASVKVFDMVGSLVNQHLIDGITTIPVSKGFYLVQVSVEGKQKTIKVLVK